MAKKKKRPFDRIAFIKANARAANGPPPATKKVPDKHKALRENPRHRPSYLKDLSDQ